MDLIKIAEEAFESGKKHPEFGPGDTITVAYRIKEGNKERIQQYRGVVIRISGEGNKKRFTVRKMSDNIGVERIFPIESPFIDSITVNKYGKVRRAKLFVVLFFISTLLCNFALGLAFVGPRHFGKIRSVMLIL